MFIRETIREHFQALQKRARYTSVVVAILVGAALFFWFPGTRQQAALCGLIAAIVLFVVISLYFRRQFSCPSCKTDLLKLEKQQTAADGRRFWDSWDKCPQCGISFNDIWPY
jgi:hypothetical protein